MTNVLPAQNPPIVAMLKLIDTQIISTSSFCEEGQVTESKIKKRGRRQGEEGHIKKVNFN